MNTFDSLLERNKGFAAHWTRLGRRAASAAPRGVWKTFYA